MRRRAEQKREIFPLLFCLSLLNRPLMQLLPQLLNVEEKRRSTHSPASPLSFFTPFGICLDHHFPKTSLISSSLALPHPRALFSPRQPSSSAVCVSLPSPFVRPWPCRGRFHSTPGRSRGKSSLALTPFRHPLRRGVRRAYYVRARARRARFFLLSWMRGGESLRPGRRAERTDDEGMRRSRGLHFPRT